MRPKSLELHRCFTVPHARLGWILLIIGAFSWQMFGRHADWSSLLFVRHSLAQANGVVRDVNRTGYTVGDEFNGAPICSVHYEFSDGAGRFWKGRSWTERQVPRVGEQVVVEFAISHPQISRIKNLRSGPLPLWAGTVLLFPIFGINCIVTALLFNRDRWSNSIEGSKIDKEQSAAPQSQVGRDLEA